jgi:excisionase family DNA binding protein
MHQKRPPRIAQVETSEQDGRAGSGGRNDDGRWLSIHDACALLGVDQSTLRRWSDAGKVPVFRTPGGHRRYAEADLVALVGEGPARRERPRVSQQTLTDRSLSAYEDEYLRVVRERRWFRAYGPATQEEHRRLGRRLVDLAVRYAAVAPAAGDRASLLDEGRQIGGHYGRAGAGHGLTPAEMVEAFLYFRYPVVRAVTGMIEEQELAARRAIRVFAEISHFMDQILVATVAAHESEASRRGDEQTGAFDAGPSTSPRLLVSSSPLPEGP